MEHDSVLRFGEVPETRLDEALALAYLAFHTTPEDDAKRKHHYDTLRECARVGAYDGDRLVGLMATYDFTLSLPGGELPAPGLTFVSVAPTHRRRGALAGMIAELYRRLGEANVPLACLWASEDAIYGRFGFGTSTRGFTVEIDSSRPLALRIEPDGRPLRLVAAADAPALLGPYYERTRAERGGRMARTEAWWREEWLVEKDEEDASMSPPRIVALGEPLAGYVIYRTKKDNDGPGLVRLDELEADTPAVAAALWRYLASIDLTQKVTAWGRPFDDPLLHFCADRDQVRVTGVVPSLRVRLIDVPAALRARTWAADVDVVLDIRDGQLPANAGHFRLTAAPDGCAYEPTDAPADLSMDVRELAACYLGDTPVRELVRASLVTEHTAGAAATLDAALHTELAPHTMDGF
ncbi:GNAT family N-acetyltransferase [Streptomyces zagrosensis]|uniref:Putative acetyltransferase n=1 Tax=Streptomyces zagrosensis TaxID=1042984 RepID=A0A7W9Q5H1_9ACTN|nr:GNAT family N-acetyltransferase [Streptomyces zagrosensis]MBB5933865.1 putative acetyltransferase [Streptomyces zagrosensis]